MLKFNEFLLEGKINPAFKKNNFIKNLKNRLYNTKEKDEQLNAINDFYEEMTPFFKKVEKKLRKIINKNLTKKNKDNVKILTNIKHPDSLYNKYIERGKDIMEINDIVRSAVLFEEKYQVQEFVEKLKRKLKNQIEDYEKKRKR